MLAKVSGFGLIGIDAYPIEIEVDVSCGLPSVTVVGLADTVVRESKERVKAAIKNSGFIWPKEKITINLAPSDFKKEGTYFDLGIALGVLAATEQINSQKLRDFYVCAELSLDGSLRQTPGILPLLIAATQHNIKDVIIPHQNAREAAIVQAIRVWPMQTLKETVEFINNPEGYKPFSVDLRELFEQSCNYHSDFSEVKGQVFAKRAIEIAIAGAHNMLMIGPPGSGKTMLAKRIPTIMPDLTLNEALEITKIHSVAGTLATQDGIIATRPFRNPHHTISNIALVGGGSIPKPGEVSLAHRGILFLDELPEFHRDCLEALRLPLEDGNVRVSRIIKTLLFPASFILVAAMNPCPCGTSGQPKNSCRCSTTQIARYRARISGPLLDRIDIHIEVPATKYHELTDIRPAENSHQIKERINKARAIQNTRLKTEGILCNAQMNHKQVRKFCLLGKEENELLKMAMAELNFSARAYDKILKVSRTIADLAGSEQIKTEHLSEAIQYRSLDREFFI